MMKNMIYKDEEHTLLRIFPILNSLQVKIKTK